MIPNDRRAASSARPPWTTAPSGVEAWIGRLMATYVFLLYSVGRFEQAQLFVIWVLGPVCAGVVLIHLALRPLRFPPELVLYVAIGFWALAGFPLARDLDAFLRYARLLFQIAVLALAIHVALVRSRRLQPFLWAIAGAAIFQALYSLLRGEPADWAAQHETLTSFSGNPNELGYVAVVGVIALAMLWRDRPGLIWRAALAGAIGLLTVAVVLTASRKAFLTLALFMLGWLWVSFRDRIRRQPLLVGVMLAVLVVGVLAASRVLTSTYLGERLTEYQSAEELREENVRVSLYEQGFDMFLWRPITGVGLAQFNVYSIGNRASHSDLLELLATTGLVGTTLYLAMYAVLFRRARRLQAAATDDHTRYRAGMVQVTLLSLIAVGLGRINFIDIITMIVLTTLVSYTWALEQHAHAAVGWLRARALSGAG